ncbi:hypothetical protein [Methylacidiphilum kamchatkense]|uniref:Uncharacterized protein n=1 Tax=Methylacidiphilum kamchatkense Kam1 TaxID=1202785 RepID=A0A516TPS5_9BACT|nr:hypothetical protein [Methylacidiphilum kamchatkense]QDQ43239.1 hypothetical protein kam1_2030 [Methylacidiphilum kamchatkense Kam1]
MDYHFFIFRHDFCDAYCLCSWKLGTYYGHRYKYFRQLACYRDQKGENKTVEISPSTQYVFKGNPSSLDNLKKGMRVVVHAKKSGDKLEAKEVKFGAPAKKLSPSTQQ